MQDHPLPAKMVSQGQQQRAGPYQRQVVGATLTSSPQQLLANSDRPGQARRFSLGRSLSLRPSPSSASSRKFLSKSLDRWTEPDRRIENKQTNVGVIDELSDKLRREAVEQPAAAAAPTGRPEFVQRRNLSSLFRSKSLRIISSGKQKANVAELMPSNGVAGYIGHRNRPPVCNSNEAFTGHSNTLRNRQQQATIDYLATAQPHKRTFSIRRNSLLTFNTKDDSFVANNGGKIVLFLRKLFSIRRRTTTTSGGLQHNLTGPEQLGRDHHHHYHHHRTVSEERIIRQHFVGSPTLGSSPNEESNNSFHNSANQRHRSLPAKPLRPLNNSSSNNNKRQLITPASPSSSSSSGSSSLIEILDCSSAVNSSRRPLREEKLVNISNNSARATTFRLIKRSESSLSHNSDKSNASSTTNSTVSQQLRRHLDEAYRRHRNCTNQSEKEFIDSINVLRQASRHALQPSSPSSHHQRSSSKSSRQTKSTISAGSSRNANNRDLLSGDDTASSIASFESSEHKSSNRRPTLGAPSSPIVTNSPCQCIANKHQPPTNNGQQAKLYHPNSIDQQRQQQQKLDLSQEESLSNFDDDHKHDERAHQLVSSNINLNHLPTTHELNNNSQKLTNSLEFGHCFEKTAYLSSGCQENPLTLSTPPAQNEASCCICNYYLSSVARLCPANFFPTGSCCPAMNEPSLPLSLHTHKQMSQPEAMSEYCCPLWRSMVYNYPPFLSGHQLNYNYPSTIGSVQKQNASNQPTNQQQQLSDNFSTQEQQHQHNTTIDLKIEIGADFKKSKRQIIKGTGIRRIQLGEQKHNLKLVPEMKFNSCLDDSLESSDVTDESLNIKLVEQFERDSCEISSGETSNTGSQSDYSNNKFDSLQQQQQARTTSTDEEDREVDDEDEVQGDDYDESLPLDSGLVVVE